MQYEIRFLELAHHAIWWVPTDRERIRRFIDGLTYQLQLLMSREGVYGATFDEVVDIARQIEMVSGQERVETEAKRPRGHCRFSGTPSRAQSPSHAPSAQGSSVSGPSGGYSSALGSLQSPVASRGCFKFGDLDHIKRYCPRLTGGSSQQKSQPSITTPVPPPAQPARGGAQSVRGRSREGGISGGGQARFYALPSRQDAIVSDAVIISIVSVCHRDASVLFDPGSIYSYVSSYFAHFLVMPRASLVSSVHVPTHVGDTIVMDYVYRSCAVTIRGLETIVDLFLPSMVDFDLILGMDWLSLCHAVLNCHAKI
ncbi:uncharacterized protein [Nicotiana tomentosiformis]|uniref:uncharacterized protein n=1 Tax=Nicotiana tomentosiformis TaxID=4098 RepID=UPI00388C9440